MHVHGNPRACDAHLAIHAGAPPVEILSASIAGGQHRPQRGRRWTVVLRGLWAKGLPVLQDIHLGARKLGIASTMAICRLPGRSAILRDGMAFDGVQSPNRRTGSVEAERKSIGGMTIRSAVRRGG